MKNFMLIAFILVITAVFALAKPPTTTIRVATEPAITIAVLDANSPSVTKLMDQQVNCGVQLNSSVIQDNINISNTAGGLTQNGVKLGLVDNLNISNRWNQNGTGGMVQLCAPIVGFGSFSEVIQLGYLRSNDFAEVVQLRSLYPNDITEHVQFRATGMVYAMKNNAPMVVTVSNLSGAAHTSNLKSMRTSYSVKVSRVATNSTVGVKIRSHASYASSVYFRSQKNLNAGTSVPVIMNSTANKQMGLAFNNSITVNSQFLYNQNVTNNRSGKFETSLSYLNLTAGTTNSC